MNIVQDMSVKNILAKSKLAILMAFGALLLTACGSRSDIGEPRLNTVAAEEVYEIGVNAYLWRGTLDTLSFMPLLSADPMSGMVITDWKVNPNDVNERSKVDVSIVSNELQADSINLIVHRETLQNGNWTTSEPRPNAASQIIQAITIQARLLRRDNAPVTSN
ncbi:MAG: DUF3576 domain-containing protein [Emcibacteraceae bacterium]|nr:DUF3576 domain-containing protein [Emcibacteraceae bacterium]MDG1997253.1 DUF3576 domain-containing protein [Emcibacteraceae bacterium]